MVQAENSKKEGKNENKGGEEKGRRNKLDFKNFKWSRYDYCSAKRAFEKIYSKVAKKMVTCFHFVKNWRF